MCAACSGQPKFPASQLLPKAGFLRLRAMSLYRIRTRQQSCVPKDGEERERGLLTRLRQNLDQELPIASGSWVPHISLVFREMWNSAGLDRSPSRTRRDSKVGRIG